MLNIQELSLQRGGEYLLREANAIVYPGQKVALVGANGTGKSSLFALLLNQLEPDAGEVLIPAAWRVAHMRQELIVSSQPAVEFVLDGDRVLREAQAKLQTAEQNDDHNAMAECHSVLDDIGGYTAHFRAEQILMGLGFKTTDFAKRVTEFSGGWRVRLNLAQTLIQNSELLLLDEPTNHLDIDASLWLENWLAQYPGTMVLIAHDREFIDVCCEGILHLEHQTLTAYTGNYSAFELQRAERSRLQQQAFEKQQDQIAHMESFVRRFRAKASKAKQAQSRLKALERMERVLPAHIHSPFNFVFPPAERMSDPLLGLQNAELGYPRSPSNAPILSAVNLIIHPETRVGILGANGAGKSTLMKSLAGDLLVQGGERVAGEHLNIGYFSQNQLESLDLEASPLLHLQRLSPKVTEQSMRSFLGGFNFVGDRATGGIRHFSGGEKARLALAIVVWQKPNVLLLDEPTNHLDLDMRQALNMALQGFEGAVVLVSHDRYLLDNVCDSYLLVHTGKVEEFNGSLADYKQWLLATLKAGSSNPGSSPSQELGSEAQEVTGFADDAGGDAVETSDSNQQGQESLSRKQQRKNAAQARQKFAPLSRELKQLEKQMAELPVQLASVEECLGGEAIYEPEQRAELQELLQQQAALNTQLQQAEERWLQVSDELESL